MSDPTVAAFARAEVRRWVGADPVAVRSHIARLGQDTIAEAAAATARLAALVGDRGAGAAVDELRLLIEEVHTPARRRRFGIAVVPPPLEHRLADAAPTIASMLDRLAIAAEQLARDVAGARATDQRLADATNALDALIARLAALDVSVGAAARELRLDDPVRAGFLRDELSRLLAERSADVRTQQLVLNQGRLAIRLLLEGHETLLAAIDRARHLTVPALRTAVAASRALSGVTRAQESAAALDARVAVADGVQRMREALGAPDP